MKTRWSTTYHPPWKAGGGEVVRLAGIGLSAQSTALGERMPRWAKVHRAAQLTVTTPAAEAPGAVMYCGKRQWPMG